LVPFEINIGVFNLGNDVPITIGAIFCTRHAAIFNFVPGEMKILQE